jgi:alkanesulfonate monooxygenase SsuD/methylene tetrahydromethanopterin reductase-like flavin-dependent oxidoreductase (luciferase family)
LWTERSVSFAGVHEQVTGAGIAPMPIQRPIPVWIGAASERAFKRAGRIADGWFPMVPPGPDLDAARAIVEQAATDAGRDPARLGMEGRVSWTDAGVDKLVDHIDRWRAAGATHVSVNTMNAGLGAVEGHLTALARAADALDLSR